MATLDHISLSGTNYEIADAQARTDYSALASTMSGNGLAMLITDGWITGKRMGTPEVGETFTDAPGSISTWQYIKLACSPGDTFTINAVGSSVFLPWAFADADLKCLSRDSNATAANEVITAPENAAWLYINQNANRGMCYTGNLVDNRIANIENNGYANKGRLANGTDLNTVTASGVYLLVTGGGYTNAPSGLSSYGFLTVKTINTITCQKIETSAGDFARVYNSSSWGNWTAR